MDLIDVPQAQTASPAISREPNYAGRVPVGDIKMYYEIHGRGEPLLLIMGLGGHSLDWGWIIPQKLADRYEVILFDNRGAGRSDQPAGPFAIEQMARDTVGLMDTLGIDQAHVFGGSMGGMVALQMALDYPKRVDKLVLGAQLQVEDPGPFRLPKSRSTSTPGRTFLRMITCCGQERYAIRRSLSMLIRT
jgi:pimeloyl-ACP methyl ester carboxylesterase